MADKIQSPDDLLPGIAGLPAGLCTGMPKTAVDCKTDVRGVHP